MAGDEFDELPPPLCTWSSIGAVGLCLYLPVHGAEGRGHAHLQHAAHCPAAHPSCPPCVPTALLLTPCTTGCANQHLLHGIGCSEVAAPMDAASTCGAPGNGLSTPCTAPPHHSPSTNPSWACIPPASCSHHLSSPHMALSPAGVWKLRYFWYSTAWGVAGIGMGRYGECHLW